MRFDKRVDLAAEKLAAMASIDIATDVFRGNFITATPSQIFVYAEKESEANLISLNPEVSEFLTPHLSSEAARLGISRMDMAISIQMIAAQWRQLSPLIETIRMGAKDTVRNATTIFEVRAAANIDWSPVMNYL